MKIALGQINSTGRVEENLDKVRDYSRRAALDGASAIVFPEATMTAFGTPLWQACTDFGDHWRTAVSALSHETGLTIVVGEFEPSNRRVRNLAAVYRPDGGRETYAKIHTYDAFGYRESDSVEPGNCTLTVDIGGTACGIAICYDIRFPKLFAELSRSGANVILVPTSWGAGSGKAEQWNILARARALDSNTTVVAVDQADPKTSGVDAAEGAPTGIGYSTVVDPFGRVVTELGRGEELRIVNVEPDMSSRARRDIPVLDNAKLGY